MAAVTFIPCELTVAKCHVCSYFVGMALHPWALHLPMGCKRTLWLIAKGTKEEAKVDLMPESM